MDGCSIFARAYFQNSSSHSLPAGGRRRYGRPQCAPARQARATCCTSLNNTRSSKRMWLSSFSSIASRFFFHIGRCLEQPSNFPVFCQCPFRQFIVFPNIGNTYSSSISNGAAVALQNPVRVFLSWQGLSLSESPSVSSTRATTHGGGRG